VDVAFHPNISCMQVADQDTPEHTLPSVVPFVLCKVWRLGFVAQLHPSSG
jgi:hypothetical protein